MLATACGMKVESVCVFKDETMSGFSDAKIPPSERRSGLPNDDRLNRIW